MIELRLPLSFRFDDKSHISDTFIRSSNMLKSLIIEFSLFGNMTFQRFLSCHLSTIRTSQTLLNIS